MNGVLQDWVRALLAAALLLGVVETLVPEGSVRPVARFAVGPVLFLLLVRPLVELVPERILSNWESEVEAMSACSEELNHAGESYLWEVMSRESAEYIQTKAAAQGITVRAEVTCTGSDGLPLPEEAVLRGALSEEQQAWLSALVSEDLGIAPDRVRYEEVVP